MWNSYKADTLISSVEAVIKDPIRAPSEGKLKVGIDLGTSYTVLVVLDEIGKPLACTLEYAEVIRDGLVVDYLGCCEIVKRLKAEAERSIGREILNAAIAVPPGTSFADASTHRHVVESTGIIVTDVFDEPTAANAVLAICDGVVVDVGGGTTGISVFKAGKVVYVNDEATGGNHMTLVIAGNKGISFESAEKYKKNVLNSEKVFPVIVPVIEKIATIVERHIKNFDVDLLCLVGGTACLNGIESVIEQLTGVRTVKPENPFLVTPLGIAMMMDLRQ
ncbi:MAG: ethanolamine utilization protein EutJ [Synergistaceae bacterium]|nr:ethanolamine utilization protein EutJ [Synergistaceae bacterium]